MKIHFDIECTPEEAREFLGLPDIAEIQGDMIKLMQDKMQENIQSMDPESMIKTWMPMTMPTTIQSMGEMQKMFWESMKKAQSGQSSEMGSGADSSPKKPKK